jgi:hypothetical protein
MRAEFPADEAAGAGNDDETVVHARGSRQNQRQP